MWRRLYQSPRRFRWFLNAFHLAYFLLLVGLVLVSTSSAQSDEAAIANFFQWLKDHGAQFDTVAWPVDFPGTGRGGLAMRNIEDGDEYLRIPLSLCMTNDSGVGTPLEPVLQEIDGFEDLQKTGLILVLIAEKLKGTASFWAPYIQILPTHYDKLYSWSEDELNELQDPHRIREVQAEQNSLRAVHRGYLNLLKKHNVDTKGFDDLDLYMWAHSATGTRCFQINATIEYALVPYADLLNHHPESPTRWRDRDGLFIMYTSGGGFERGTQVYNNYGGDQTNFRMLFDYGFMKMDNEENTEQIDLPSFDDETHKEQLIAIRKKILKRDYIRLFYKVRPNIILRNFRVAAARTASEARSFLFPSDWRLEHKAATRCYTAITDELESMPTTLAEDFGRLHTTAVWRKRLAISYRIERKRILHQTAEFCAAVVDDILPCIPSKTVRYPRYFRLILSVVSNNAAQQRKVV